MSKTSKVDLEKYLPSVEDSLALCDEDAAAARIRKALEDPEAPPREASPKKATSAPAKASPAAKVGAPLKASAPAKLMFMGKELPPLRTVLYGILVVFLPVILVILLFVKPQQTGVQGAPTIWIEAGVGAQATVAAPTATATATATASAATASSAIPSAAPSVSAQKPKGLAPRGTIAPRNTAAPLPTVKPIIIN